MAARAGLGTPVHTRHHAIVKAPLCINQLSLTGDIASGPYPPSGFAPVSDAELGNGDYFGLYWPFGQEAQEPIVCDMAHDSWSMVPCCPSEATFVAWLEENNCQRGDLPWFDADFAPHCNLGEQHASADRVTKATADGVHVRKTSTVARWLDKDAVRQPGYCMGYAEISSLLTAPHSVALAAVKANAERLLNHTARFKFFTLHGSAHLDNLFKIFSHLLKSGINLTEQEVYLLSLAICIHDLGMVCALREAEITQVLDGQSDFPDPGALEDYIRDAHHNMVENYIEDNGNFLTAAGVQVAEIGHVREISRCHRKVVLERQSGFIKYLGALLRIIDELDIGAERAPVDVLRNNFKEMDSTSCWHWFKHNITEPWQEDHTVFFTTINGKRSVRFKIGVSPTETRTIPYWLSQTVGPIQRVLRDEGAALIVRERFNVEIIAEADESLCRVNKIDAVWQAIEKKALSSNQPVILVVDDEFRKYQDLFLPLMDKFHVVSASNAKEALIKIEATSPDLVIVDMQMSSGELWGDEQTKDFKFTGLSLCEEIRSRFPDLKIGLLTGTRYTMPDVKHLRLSFDLRKPVDLEIFTKKVANVLS